MDKPKVLEMLKDLGTHDVIDAEEESFISWLLDCNIEYHKDSGKMIDRDTKRETHLVTFSPEELESTRGQIKGYRGPTPTSKSADTMNLTFAILELLGIKATQFNGRGSQVRENISVIEKP